jgi:hypothetical protein
MCSMDNKNDYKVVIYMTTAGIVTTSVDSGGLTINYNIWVTAGGGTQRWKKIGTLQRSKNGFEAL